MEQSVESRGLVADWSLSFDELALIATKRHHVRFGFAVMLRFRQIKGRFPTDRAEIPPAAIAYLAQQTGADVREWDSYDLTPRSSRRHRADILEYLGIRRFTGRDVERATAWATTDLCPLGLSLADMTERMISWFADQRTACPEEGKRCSAATYR